ncbi:MAG: hypothetical protein RLZZ337_1465 [Bacteroidota bacterium]
MVSSRSTMLDKLPFKPTIKLLILTLIFTSFFSGLLGQNTQLSQQAHLENDQITVTLLALNSDTVFNNGIVVIKQKEKEVLDTILIAEYYQYNLTIDTAYISTESHQPILVLKTSLFTTENLGEHGVFKLSLIRYTLWSFAKEHPVTHFVASYLYKDDYMDWDELYDTSNGIFAESMSHCILNNSISIRKNSVHVKPRIYSCIETNDNSECHRAKYEIRNFIYAKGEYPLF